MSFRRGHLEYFVAVAEEGQVTSAARRLGVAQPAVSQAMAHLESETGLQLLERHARGVRLTPAGESFYAKARLAVAATGDAISTARSLARAQQGTIEFGFLGAPPSIEGRIEMEGFAMAYPDIEVRYRDLPLPDAARPPPGSARSTSRCVTCRRPTTPSGAKSIRREPRVALIPGEHPLAGRDELERRRGARRHLHRLRPVGRSRLGRLLVSERPSRRSARARHRRSRRQPAGGARRARRRERDHGRSRSPPATCSRASSRASRVIPFRDAEPARIALVGHRDQRNPLVAALLSYAEVAGERRSRRARARRGRRDLARSRA